MKRSLALTVAGLRRPLLALPVAAGTVAALAAGATAGTGPAAAGDRAGAAGPPAAAADAGTWRLLPAAPVSKPQDAITSVWTGDQMIVRGTRWTDQGMRRVTVAYDPAANTWSQLPRGPKPPVTEGSDVAVWTGTEMLLIGPTGAAYTPATRTWRTIPRPELGGPPSRIAGWTGHEAIVWGGTCCAGTTRVGGLYNPATNTWRKIQAPFAARMGVEGAWTGKELVLAGGGGRPGSNVTHKNGAAYNPATNTWRRIPQMPRRESYGDAVWDGREVLFLGGYRPGAHQPPAQGLAFNPVTNQWRKLPPMAYPRNGSAAVWTGRKLLVWGGLTGSYRHRVLPPHGEVYKPATNRWAALPKAPLHGRVVGTAVWTGRSMIVWGGWAPNGDRSTQFSDGAMYTPRWP
jgi:hypothetical protein